MPRTPIDLLLPLSDHRIVVEISRAIKDKDVHYVQEALPILRDINIVYTADSHITQGATTTLLITSISSSIEIITILLEHGADPNMLLEESELYRTPIKLNTAPRFFPC